MNISLKANLRNKSEVQYPIRDGRDAQQNYGSACKQQGTQVRSLCLLGYRGAKGACYETLEAMKSAEALEGTEVIITTALEIEEISSSSSSSIVYAGLLILASMSRCSHRTEMVVCPGQS